MPDTFRWLLDEASVSWCPVREPRMNHVLPNFARGHHGPSRLVGTRAAMLPPQSLVTSSSPGDSLEKNEINQSRVLEIE
jgi:hypothetical protein